MKPRRPSGRSPGPERNRKSPMRGAGVFIITLTIGLGIGAAQRGGRGGGIPAPLKITIPAFADGGAIPAKYGCANGTNANISPAIQWSGAPEGTATIALILHDPDVAIGGDDVLDDGAVQINNIGGSIR